MPTLTERRRDQLQMIIPEEKLRETMQHPLPEGYILRTFRKGKEDEEFVGLLQSAGFEYWNQDTLEAACKQALPDGVFMVVDESTGELTATAMAGHAPMELHPSGGELGWVAAKSHASGKGLGRAVCSAVACRFAQAGYHHVYLKTEDFRLAAIKVYLSLGFEPFLFQLDMHDRWQKICNELSWPFTPDHWPQVRIDSNEMTPRN